MKCVNILCLFTFSLIKSLKSLRSLDTHVVGVLHSQDLLSEVLKVVECRLRCDGVHQSESLAVLHVQVPHGGKLFL